MRIATTTSELPSMSRVRAFRWSEEILTAPLAPAAAGARGWLGAGAVVLAAAFVMLEMTHPYYFTQDDALVINLPGILHGCRSAWEGRFADYNPYTLMGSPHASLGLFALTYPPIYLSYALARHGLGDEAATLEVFAVLHLTAGYFLTFLLARRLRLSGLTASLVALSFVLSGCMLIMGRSWFMFLPLALWLPLLTLGVVRLRDVAVSWRWVVGMGLAIGLAFQVGFPQLGLYTTLYPGFLLLAFALFGEISWRRAAAATPALLIGVGLAVPLGYQQWLASRGMEIGPAYGEGILGALPALFLPYPLARAEHPEQWGNLGTQYMGHLVFFGGLFAFLLLLNAAALLVSGARAGVWRKQLWFCLAAITLVLTLGNAGGLWWLASRLPVLGRVNNYPFRLLPFFVLFAVLAGGIILERLLQSSAVVRRWRGLLWGGAALMLLYHASQAQTAFYTYGFAPYPPLPAEMRAVLRPPGEPPARAIALAPWRSISPALGLSMNNSLPMVYELPAFSGSDPVVQRSLRFSACVGRLLAQPAAGARAYGIRWHISIPRENLIFSPQPSPLTHIMETHGFVPAPADWLKSESLTLAAAAGGVRIDELAGVAPLAFATSEPSRSLPIRLHGGGMDVDVASCKTAGPVVLNFLYYPQMEAELDGTPVACTEDAWQRVVVDLPTTGQTLRLRFRPPWGQGLFLGGALVLLGLFLTRLVLRGDFPLAG
jgi:hypothetical protein